MRRSREALATGDRNAGRALVVACRIGVLILAIGFWAAGSHLSPGGLIPSPAATLEAATEMFRTGALWKALGQSLSVFFGGYFLAAAVAIPLGLLMGGLPLLGRTLDVYANALSATPRVAFIPLIVVLVGLDLEAMTAIVFLGAAMPILINTYAGVAVADAELTEMARSTGASRRQIFLKVRLPGAVPSVLGGLRLGAALGLTSAVVAELYTAVSGLGGLLATYGSTVRMAPYFVVVLALVCIAILITQGIGLIERHLGRHWSAG